MAWLRLSDDYMDHPKFRHISDGAFRLWHRGLSYCRRFKTDGMLPLAIVKDFKEYSPKRAEALLKPWTEGTQPLWAEVPGFGYTVHDYLEWNPSKEEENERRAESRDRMRLSRERRASTGVAPVTAQRMAPVTRATSREVLDRDREKGSEEEEENDRSPEMRAGRLVERFAELYRQHRRGARYAQRPNLDWHEAIGLCRTWEDDAHLDKLIVIFLKSDDPFIASTDRGFKIFALKATWCDDRLREWEATRKQA